MGPPQPVISVPRPITAPRRGLTFSPGVIVAALLTVAVLLVGAYLAVQVMRFAKPPTLDVTDPKVATLTVDESRPSYVLRGTTIPGGTVTVEVAGGSRQTSADSTGAWSVEIDLRRGKNQFKIDATDPDTGKHAEQVGPGRHHRPRRSPRSRSRPLTVDQPADGADVRERRDPGPGHDDERDERVGQGDLRRPGRRRRPAGAGASAAAGAGAASSVPVDEDGAFDTPLQLTTGRWSIIVTASGAGGKTDVADPPRHGRATRASTSSSRSRADGPG